LYEVESLTNQMSKDEIKGKKSITQNDLKIRVKKTLIRGQLKISFDMRFVAGCNCFVFKNWVYRLFWYDFFLHNINYKCKSKKIIQASNNHLCK